MPRCHKIYVPDLWARITLMEYVSDVQRLDLSSELAVALLAPGLEAKLRVAEIRKDMDELAYDMDWLNVERDRFNDECDKFMTRGEGSAMVYAREEQYPVVLWLRGAKSYGSEL